MHCSFVFFGTGEFAQIVLKKLVESRRKPLFLVTAPDRRSGRGLKLRPQPLKTIAQAYSIQVLQPEKLNGDEMLLKLGGQRPDFIVVTDYGKIIPPSLLKWPKLAPLNIHPSLLPRFRGAAPIERAMMACERKLGVTVIIMDEGIDTGDILLQREIEVEETETKGEVAVKLAEIGFELIVEAMERFHELSPTPQPSEGASYAKKIRKEELWVDWEQDAKSIACKINALSPRPGARAYFDRTYVKLLRAKVAKRDGVWEVGTVVIEDYKLFVAAGHGFVEILELQPEGKKPMKASDYLKGHKPQKAWSSKPTV